MEDYKLGEMEGRFAQLIWQHQPVASGALVPLCQQAFGWKKSTTYTMLRRLCRRGIFENKEGLVRSLMTPNQLEGLQSRQFVQQTFQGSLPKFLAAFSGQKKLSPQEVEALQRLIDAQKEGGHEQDI